MCDNYIVHAMSDISSHDIIQHSVSDVVKMETDPAYQIVTSDQVDYKKGPDPAYQVHVLSSSSKSGTLDSASDKLTKQSYQVQLQCISST